MSFKGWSDKTKARFLQACDYSDLMWEVKDPQGKVLAYVSAYYLCMHDWKDYGGDCLTLILSKDWCRFYEAPMRDGQRWHCNSCGVRQKPHMGMLLEIWLAKQSIPLCHNPGKKLRRQGLTRPGPGGKVDEGGPADARGTVQVPKATNAE